MEIDRRKYLYRIKRLEIKSWLKYLMIQGKSVIDYVLGELMTGTNITIDNTVEKTFYKFDIKGNSTQDGTPSPETEVPILSAGDNGTISEKIVNKNKFDGEIETGSIISNTGALSPNALGWYSKNFYSVKPNTTYIVSYSSTDYTFGMRVAQYTANQTFSTRPVTNSSPYSFTTGNDIYFIKLSGKTGDTNIQLEQGSTATTYTAHQEQTYTIPTQQPMRSIGTVRDEFIQVNGNWFERHNIKSIIFNGSEGWTSTGTQYTGLYSAYVILSDIKRQNIFSGDLLSNYFIEKGFSVQEEGMTKSLQPLDFDFLILRISTDKASTAQELKTWLSTHNTEVLYLLATPQDLPCTSEQIAILENLPKSYNEQTNIYSIDVTPAYLEIQAYVKKEEVIEND